MSRVGSVAVIAIVVMIAWLVRRPSSASEPNRIVEAATSVRTPRRPARVNAHGDAGGPAAIVERIVASDLRATERSRPRGLLRASDIDLIKTQLHDAVPQVMPRLRDCYESAIPNLVDPSPNVDVDLTLTGDPDIGTMIDADVLLDPHSPRLPGSFVDCTRSVLQTLELPALAEGERVVITYPLAFGE